MFQRSKRVQPLSGYCRGNVGIISFDDLSGFASWLSPPSVYLLTESRGPKDQPNDQATSGLVLWLH